MKIIFTSPVEMEIFLYKAPGPGPHPNIFIIPIFGKMPFLEKVLAKLFAKKGFNSFITDFMPDDCVDDCVEQLDIHEKTYKKSVIGLEVLRLELKKMPFADEERVGIFGMSLGGIFTALNMKANPNFKASVIIAGGGSNKDILSKSEHFAMVALKEKRKERFHLESDEEYAELIDQNIQSDALKISGEVDPEKVLMYIATKDKHVPTRAQVKTWKAFNRPRARFLRASHFELILGVPVFHFKQIVKFFTKKLGPVKAP